MGIAIEVTCESCRRPLTDEEIDEPAHDLEGRTRAWCTECECEQLHFPCIQCENCGEMAEQHRLLVVIDAEYVEMPQGVYLIRELPYYTSGLISASWMHERALAYLGPLPAKMDPKPEHYDYSCGHLCGDCIAAYRLDPRWAAASVWWG